VRHDSTKEIDAAVREATAPLIAQYAEARIKWADALAVIALRDATIMELRAEIDRLTPARRERDDAWKKLNVKDDTIAKQREEIERLTEAHATETFCCTRALDRNAAYLTAIKERDATIMELRDHLSQAAEAHKSEVAGWRKQAEVNLGEVSNQVGIVDRLTAQLAELTRCRTAADLQHARERRPGYPWNGAKFSRSDLIA
jgi:hypothetical protein